MGTVANQLDRFEKTPILNLITRPLSALFKIIHQNFQRAKNFIFGGFSKAFTAGGDPKTANTLKAIGGSTDDVADDVAGLCDDLANKLDDAVGATDDIADDVAEKAKGTKNLKEKTPKTLKDKIDDFTNKLIQNKKMKVIDSIDDADDIQRAMAESGDDVAKLSKDPNNLRGAAGEAIAEKTLTLKQYGYKNYKHFEVTGVPERGTVGFDGLAQNPDGKWTFLQVKTPTKGTSDMGGINQLKWDYLKQQVDDIGELLKDAADNKLSGETLKKANGIKEFPVKEFGDGDLKNWQSAYNNFVNRAPSFNREVVVVTSSTIPEPSTISSTLEQLLSLQDEIIGGEANIVYIKAQNVLSAIVK